MRELQVSQMPDFLRNNHPLSGKAGMNLAVEMDYVYACVDERCM